VTGAVVRINDHPSVGQKYHVVTDNPQIKAGPLGDPSIVDQDRFVIALEIAHSLEDAAVDLRWPGHGPQRRLVPIFRDDKPPRDRTHDQPTLVGNVTGLDTPLRLAVGGGPVRVEAIGTLAVSNVEGEDATRTL